MSVIGDHAAKKLEKLMAREAKAEEQNIKHARKDVKKAEKAVKKSVKVRALLLCPGPRCVRRLVPILMRVWTLVRRRWRRRRRRSRRC